METGLINLVNYNKVIVSTENISYYYSNIENLASASNQQVVIFAAGFHILLFQQSKFFAKFSGDCNKFVLA